MYKGKGSDVPTSITKQATCRAETDGEKCGADAYNTVGVKVRIMERDVNVKLPVCDKHLSETIAIGRISNGTR